MCSSMACKTKVTASASFELVPRLTDAPGNFEMIAFAGSLGNVQRVTARPFHQMSRFK